MLIHYLKVTLRNLRKHKTQSIVNIFGLSVGFACFILWMTATDIRLPKGFPGAERSFSVGHFNSPYRKEVSIETIEKVIQQFPQIEQFTLFKYPQREYLSTSDDDESVMYQAQVMPVSPNYFHFLSAEFDAGNIPADSETGLMIDSKYAKKMFGNESPLGRTVYINHEALTITGVINLHGYSWWADFYRLNDLNLMTGAVRLDVRLHKNASIPDFIAQIRGIENVKPDGSIDFMNVFPMDTASKQVTSFVVIKLFILLIGSLLLIVALFNYISLTNQTLCKSNLTRLPAILFIISLGVLFWRYCCACL